MNKQQIFDMPTKAYYSALSGVEIKGIIEQDADLYIIAVSGAWCSKKTAHRVKIYYNKSGEPYFKLYGVKIPLNDCIRNI